MVKNHMITIAIASGKGGTGKTLVATNLFYVLQQLDYQVTLVDCDAEEPNDLCFFSGEVVKSVDVYQRVPVIDENKCVFCGKCHEYCNYNAIFILPQAKIIKVIDDICHGCGACSVACSFDAIREKDVILGTVSCYSITDHTAIVEARMEVGVLSPVPVIKTAIKEADNIGIVLLDSSPGTSCPFIQTVINADYVILVTEPTPFGLSDLKQSVETLKTLNKPYGVIINRVGLGNCDVEDYLREEKITDLMDIPYDKAIASHYSNGLIAIRDKQNWQNKFSSMFDKIHQEYGNCVNQR